jgi:hypothetical protein
MRRLVVWLLLVFALTPGAAVTECYLQSSASPAESASAAPTAAQIQD